ncbi:protein I'm not dead yet-like [Anticarsia gemmatalis]|uniref:protein I'm not dead yet-like n=1 Tax=Anticarsia gemmatalis TaxID=129554 RepID=UPI003F768F93
MFGRKEPPPPTMVERLKLFFAVHWRGVLLVVWPIAMLFLVLPLPGEKSGWTAYTLILMGMFWVTEALPLAVTGFFPIIILPLAEVLSTKDVCKAYMNDTIFLFLGSLFLASAVEQSGLHKRMAYFAIRLIGYSHYKLLFAMCSVTTFVSMWITNTAATTMVTPINFALLKVFEDQRVLKIYDRTKAGDDEASDITACYFCAATFSATIGGIGTLVGTATNLVFKGLFSKDFPDAPELISFPLYSAFAIPTMVALEACLYLWLIVVYLGFMRPNSPQAKKSAIPDYAKKAAKLAIDKDTKKLGKITFWEIMVLILFGGAMVAFFCRSPQLFTGWADIINTTFDKPSDLRMITDSAVAMGFPFLMLLAPNTLNFIKNFTAKAVQHLPKKPIGSVLDWATLNRSAPYSFMFLLGGGFALSTAAKSSGLNDKIGEHMTALAGLSNFVVMLLIILVVIFITNFASNVAVANVFVPIAMNLAVKLDKNPLWYCVVAGMTASFCFCIPVGTPGNLVVQSAAKISTKKMIYAGSGPTVSTIIVSMFFFYFWAPIIWPVLHEMPEWTGGTTPEPEG